MKWQLFMYRGKNPRHSSSLSGKFQKPTQTDWQTMELKLTLPSHSRTNSSPNVTTVQAYPSPGGLLDSTFWGGYYQEMATRSTDDCEIEGSLPKM